MSLRLPAIAFCILAAPAVAQDDAIYAPCLAHVPPPEEFADMSGHIAAMEEAGWNHRTWDTMRRRAAPALAEIDLGAGSFPQRFRNVAEVQGFAARAMELFERDLELIEIFTFGDISASISAVELHPGEMSVLCTFAGPDVPGVDDIFAEDARTRDDIAITFGQLDLPLPDAAMRLTVTAIRFNGPDDVLAPLTGREGINVSYAYQVTE